MTSNSSGIAGASGAQRLLHDVVHHRERFRQFLGIVLAMVLALTATPARLPFFVALPPFVVGLIVRFWASGHVRKDQQLATDGPYAFVRHPQYVGNTLILFAFCLVSGNWWSWVVSLVFMLLFYPPAIRQEDAKLRRLFTEAWDAWGPNVKALIPRITPYRSGDGGGSLGRWSLAQSLRQNGEPIIATFLVVLMIIVGMKLPAG